MKQIIRVLFTIAISFVLSSCTKEGKTFSLIATTESCTNDKTLLERHYDNNGNEYFDIKWEIGDWITIYELSEDLEAYWWDGYYVDSISQDGRRAYLRNEHGGNEVLDNYILNPIAVYPSGIFSTYESYYDDYFNTDFYLSDGCPILYLYPTQDYSETNVIRGFPMVSSVNMDDFNHDYQHYHLHLSFHNICGILRIKIKDGGDNITRVKKVKISSSHQISGDFTLSGYQLYGYDDHPSGHIELSCLNANNGTGVPLAIGGTDFYFYVPPTIMNDMVVEVTNMNDEVATKNLSGHEIQIMRSQLTGIKVDFTNVPFN